MLASCLRSDDAYLEDRHLGDVHGQRLCVVASAAKRRGGDGFRHRSYPRTERHLDGARFPRRQRSVGYQAVGHHVGGIQHFRLARRPRAIQGRRALGLVDAVAPTAAMAVLHFVFSLAPHNIVLAVIGALGLILSYRRFFSISSEQHSRVS